jgi:hypothetical protein
MDKSVKRWARIGLMVLLAWLARGAFRSEYGAVPLITDIDAAVHEFGHMLFMPFGIMFLGQTMMILGGSLIQVVFPLIFVVYFLRPHENGVRRDVYAACVCLWWTSINLLGVAIYANDARAGVLMLINGQTGQDIGGQDWTHIFTAWGVLDQDTVIAARMRAVASLLCVASILAGVYVAWMADDSAQGLPAESEAPASA